MRLSKHRFDMHVLSISPEALRRSQPLQRFGLQSDARLQALADALAASPVWAEMPRATLIVRTLPQPLLGVVGYFDSAGMERLEILRRQLEHGLPRLRYVDYGRAQEDCERLAARLLERFGRNELRNYRFVAIPRGGYIVLGMLAYLLDLQASQLEPPHPPDAPLVVVDDCALSGVRFHQFLERTESSEVLFAHLYSPRRLRDAIERRESHRVTCVSANDLHDYAPEDMGEGYFDWRERWRKRMGHRGYWVGQLDRICFAWNEPDSSFWNPVSEKDEAGWRFVPPEFCLKNRSALDAGSIPVQVQPRGKEPLKPSTRVLFGEFEGNVALGNLETEESYLLDGVGADMWRAIVTHGNLEEVANELAKSYQVENSTLAVDLHRFVQDLLSQGLLENDA